MGTTKRERQKAGRQSRLAAAEAAARKARTRRRAITFVVILALVLGTTFLISALTNDDNSSDVSTKNTTSTTVAPAVLFGDGKCPPADGSAKHTLEFKSAPQKCIDPSKTYKAKVETNKGTFTITLDAKQAPATVNNFVVLARYHYFDGVPFHRIIPGFVVQGGDPTGEGGGGPGYVIKDELPDRVKDYTEGSVAMANGGPDTNGSQFFVWLGPNPLPGPSYSLFGKVTEGLDVVKKLEATGTPEGTPKEPSEMVKVTITES